MHCDFLFSGRTGMEYDPGREEKDLFLRRAFSRKAKDAPRQVPKLMLEGASPLSDRSASASSRKSEEVITDEPHAGKLARVVLAGLS
ncbi:hypothetical protein Q3G72_016450 [Acer saccharum]|nr:hypothetical protein Q3G72_016450 [Acer saccharum]